ncbi:DUF2683 family protein [Brumimicrobium oceani]|uniref:Uncharacterized protein n=1 Tax=Brumimicrobium oceani TaxID=2100725 RepID=A0A2U2XDY4_9FLAO|nr:DUF2683 family protein [Brumimicrobium oceani]PWH86012.1 hypothetical protein DIT68_05505 [Brumimicrobium oceani]
MEANSLFIFHPSSNDEAEALKAIAKAMKIKFEITKDIPYNPDFVKKIQESKKQAKEGKTVQIDLDEIWKD